MQMRGHSNYCVVVAAEYVEMQSELLILTAADGVAATVERMAKDKWNERNGRWWMVGVLQIHSNYCNCG